MTDYCTNPYIHAEVPELLPPRALDVPDSWFSHIESVRNRQPQKLVDAMYDMRKACDMPSGTMPGSRGWDLLSSGDLSATSIRAAADRHVEAIIDLHKHGCLLHPDNMMQRQVRKRDSSMTAEERLSAVARLFRGSKCAVAHACHVVDKSDALATVVVRRNVRQPTTVLGAMKHGEEQRKRRLRKKPRLPPLQVPTSAADRPTPPSVNDLFSKRSMKASCRPQPSANTALYTAALPTQAQSESPTSVRSGNKTPDPEQASSSSASADQNLMSLEEMCQQALELVDALSDSESDDDSDQGDEQDSEEAVEEDNDG